MSTPVETVQDLFAARRAGDFVRMNALCAEAFAFTFNADPHRIGMGTTLIGWRAVTEHLARVDGTWEQVESVVEFMRPAPDDPEQVVVQLRFRLRHRASGHVLEGLKRQEWTVRDGIATRATEILDRDAIHAFQRFAAYGEDTGCTNRS